MITLQASGSMPITFSEQKSFMSSDVIEKRTISLTVYKDIESNWWYSLSLHTQWDDERGSTTVGGPFADDHDHLELMQESIKHDAAFIMPPGSGYPATPEYAARQTKLEGKMFWLAITCLSKVLLDIYQSDSQKP